jgi:hypothetical protein
MVELPAIGKCKEQVYVFVTQKPFPPCGKELALCSRWSQRAKKGRKKMENVKPPDSLGKLKGGRPVKAIKRDSGIRVRLSSTEHYLIEQKAKKAGMKISDWVRHSAKRATVTGRLTPEDVRLLRMLSGMANNLNQLTKLAHQQGLLVIQRKCRELMSEIDDVLKFLNKDDR